jgi:hypothetical protein
VTTKTDSGWITNTFWDSSDLTCGSSYSFRVKAKNEEGVETGWTSLGSQSSVKCIVVLTPNGGEIIPSGSGYDIQWDPTPEAVSFDLFYSLDSGVTWISIAKDLRNTIHPWTVPKVTGNKKACLVRVIGYNGTRTKKIGSDTSDRPFAIEVVKLSSPNGGESLSSGSSYEIQWKYYGTKAPVTTINLYHTKDGGTTWVLINNPPIDDAASTRYNWTVPPVASSKSQCKVRVVLRDASGNTLGSDLSDSFLTIKP